MAQKANFLLLAELRFILLLRLANLLTLHCMATWLWAKPVFSSSQREVYNDVLSSLKVEVRSDKPLEACTQAHISPSIPCSLLHLSPEILNLSTSRNSPSTAQRW
jgi:hypothetical protein